MTGSEKTVIAQGRTAEILAWQDHKIIKLFFDWVPTSAIEREKRAAQCASVTDLPTPKLLGEMTLENRKGLIYERVEGKSMLTLLGAKPWLCVGYARQFAKLHAAIHKQSGAGLPKFTLYLANVIREMKEFPIEIMAAAIATLEKLPEAEMLCHLDYHPDQVMMTAAGAQVIDWMNARSGNPAADVAYTLVILRYGASPDGGWLRKQLVNLLRGIFSGAYLREYLKQNPVMTRKDIHDWMPFAMIARMADDVPGERLPVDKLMKRF